MKATKYKIKEFNGLTVVLLESNNPKHTKEVKVKDAIELQRMKMDYARNNDMPVYIDHLRDELLLFTGLRVKLEKLEKLEKVE